MMSDTKFRLAHAVTDTDVAEEISKRLISDTPADAEEAQDILDSLDLSDEMAQAIAERLTTALAGDKQGAAGKELAHKINAMVDVLKAKASASTEAVAAEYTGTPAGASTAITLIADVAGAAGNDIVLEFDGEITIEDAINAWNADNEGNEVSLDDGDDSQVPDEGSIQLSGGEDASADDVTPAKEAMGDAPMSADAKICLVHALTDEAAAADLQEAYNAMVEAVQAIDNS